MSDYYKLNDDHTTSPCDLEEWVNVMSQDRRVAFTDLGNGYIISTVFLGLDHNWGEGTPLLFETMVFSAEEDEYMQRYTTWEQARRGHKKTMQRFIDRMN